MKTHSPALHHSAALYRDPVAPTAHWLHQLLARLRALHARRREARLLRLAERQIRELDPRTLCDIGAPYGLAGQRRWQDEQERFAAEYTLRLGRW
jgi:hypothetical protein